MLNEIGPQYVIEVYNPRLKVRGFLVIDNTKLGPGKGGIRMTPTVTVEEVKRLARAMSYKNALAGLPFGGAKSGIAFDPKRSTPAEKRAVVAWFARELKPLIPHLYIAGPDINMTEREMAVFVRAAGTRRAATGKPHRLGGLPHELGSTGFGVAVATKLALRDRQLPVNGARVAIEGYGNVGVFAARFLHEAGARIVAVSDSRGTIYHSDGLDLRKLEQVKKQTGSVINYSGAKRLDNSKIFELPVEILIPAALPDVINKGNAGKVKAKIVVEGANIAVTEEAEAILKKRGVLVIPDIIANAGGVISSYAEDRGLSEDRMFKLIESKISRGLRSVLAETKKRKSLTPRAAALLVAKRKLD